MPRFRRYRVFLFVAILTVLTLYHLTRAGNWEAAANISVERLKNLGKDQSAQSTKDTAAPETSKDEDLPVKVEDSPQIQVTSAPVIDIVVVPEITSSTTTSSTSTLEALTAPTPETRPPPSKSNQLGDDPDTEPAISAEQIKQQFGQHGQGRLEAKPSKSELPQPHWTKHPEHFPVLPASLIPLPTGSAKNIPKIQKVFGLEAPTAKTERERKLATVKDAFIHAWAGYKEYALPHDELKPVSGEHKDPFNGWGATLVDTLDTLWIMGLKQEFESAIEAVAKIDFTTSLRKDIPLFETVIRYLGGLVGAYDISNQEYPTLLEKAEELAEILMGAFDTPNRMPMTYYNWAPSYASQPHRAGTRVVMAELGSLSMEFTRLAQLTKEDKYYDAIARITNELEAWQGSTRLPGLWPVHLDASGCKKPMQNLAQLSPLSNNVIQEPLKEEPAKDGATVLNEAPKSKAGSIVSKTSVEEHVADTAPDPSRLLDKRQLHDSDMTLTDVTAKAPSKDGSALAAEPLENAKLDHTTPTEEEVKIAEFEEVDCEPQGLAAPPNSVTDEYTIGAMTDSTFEYLPKQYMLLGGQLDQYRTMYEYAMDTAREALLFRPMTPDNRDILFAGKFRTPGPPAVTDLNEEGSGSPKRPEPHFTSEGAHLTCFAGGMFAMGAKIFGIEGDLEIGRRITDGCVWAYEATTVGIMPEAFDLVACESTKTCKWSDEAWYDALDPRGKERMERVRQLNESQKKLAEKLAAEEAEAALEDSSVLTPVENALSGSGEIAAENVGNTDDTEGLVKRQIGKARIQQADDSTAAAAKARTVPGESSTVGDNPAIFKGAIRYEDDDTTGSAAGTKRVAPGDSTGADGDAPLVKSAVRYEYDDATGSSDAIEVKVPTKASTSQVTDQDNQSPTRVTTDTEHVTKVMKSIFTPQPIVSHEDYAMAVAKERRLPPGFKGINAREYILR